MLTTVPTSGKPLFILILVILIFSFLGSLYNALQGYCIPGVFGECDENYTVFIGFLNTFSSVIGWIIGGILIAKLFVRKQT